MTQATTPSSTDSTAVDLHVRLADSPLFTAMPTPGGEATVSVLTEKVAPFQQGFYFVNDSMTREGRYLWFMAAFPPNRQKTLGLVDFQSQRVHHFPETSAQGAYIDPQTGEAYFTVGPAIWKRGPEPDAVPEKINQLPADFIGGRQFNRLATHLTPTADGRAFFVDSQFGPQWWMGTLPVDGGDYEPWCRMDRNYNHAQASPTDPNLALFSQEFHSDPITGLCFDITDRMWLVRRGGQPRPLMPEPTRCTHEFWDPDGEHIWFIWHPDDENHGTYRVNIQTAEAENVWPARCAWHSHLHPSGKYLVGDRNPFGFHRGARSLVEFFNIETGRTVRLADNPERADDIGRGYHIDPHPRFVAGGELVVFTTTVRGAVDVALARTEDLIECTS